MKRHLLNILVCPVDKNPLKLFEFEATDEIVGGILYCQKCHRWYPIIEAIPVLLPDKYRNFSEVALLHKYRGYLPVKLIEEGEPFNILSMRPEEDKVVDAQKVEKRFRDEYITTRHQARKGRQSPNCFSLTKSKTILKLLNAARDDLILDVGIGPGAEYTRELAKQNIEIVGIDFSFPSLKICKQRHDLNGENRLHVIQADACHLPFSDEAFDKVISTQLIQHIPSSSNRNIAFNEINRVLKGGGDFILDVLNEYYLQRLIGVYLRIGRWITLKEAFPSLKQEFYLYLYNHKELVNDLSKHFTDISVKGMHSLFPFYMLWKKFLGTPLANISAIEFLMDRYLPSNWWARSLIAKCRKN